MKCYFCEEVVVAFVSIGSSNVFLCKQHLKNEIKQYNSKLERDLLD